MIFISSSCIKSEFIKDSVYNLSSSGFKHIELSGGTNYYDYIEKDLIALKKEFDLNYLIHNYFPPPSNHFVLNLASLEDSVFNSTINHIKSAIKLAVKLGSKKYSFHAGFRINPDKKELGNRFTGGQLFDKELSGEKFLAGYKQINENGKNIALYIENNVLTSENYKRFNENPFMLVNSNDYFELKKKVPFNLLLDIAHLKVTCNTLNLNFENQLEQLIECTDYIHLSNNDGFSDSNQEITRNSRLYNILKNYSFKNKTITLEIYSNLDSIKRSYHLMEELL